MKSDRLAGLRFIIQLRALFQSVNLVLDLQGGRIFDRGVVDRSIATLLILSWQIKFYQTVGYFETIF